MKNRYGVEYDFVKVSNNVYTITGELTHWRFGGKEGQQHLDANDLGFVDPSGGPFIGLSTLIYGKKVINISAKEGKIYFTLEE